MITSLQDAVRLAGGVEMPGLGLGCYKASEGEIADSVRWAAQAGYRLFDTAAFYQNEEAVGRAVRACGVPREELFVTTKLWPQEYGRAARAVDESLRRLDLGHADLFLLHWPGTDEAGRYRAWEALLKARDRGDVRAVGVSNFMTHHLEALIREFGVTPAVNQIELHPWWQQRELCAYCRAHGIGVNAWGPIFRGRIAEVPLMDELAARYGRSPVQITLRWHIQHEHIVIPKSVHRDRILQNGQVFDFALSDEDMARIDALDCGRHFARDPDTYNGD